MKDDLFAEIVESVQQGAAILRGSAAPSRSSEVEIPPRIGVETQNLEPQSS